MTMVSTEEALQFLMDQLAANRVAVLGLAQALGRTGAIDLDTFADQIMAVRLTGETNGAVKARAELAELLRASARSSPPILQIVTDNDNEDER